jgi:hypothetical protein
MRKHLFAEPGHRPLSGISIICGLLIIVLSFGFRGEGAINTRIGFFALGLAFMLIGSAEFLPRNAIAIAGIVRSAAYVSTFISCLFIVLLWVGIRL